MPAKNQSLISFKNYYGKKEFYDNFMTILKEKLANCYNIARASLIVSYLKKGLMSLENLELFFFDYNDTEDFDNKYFSESETVHEYFQKVIMQYRKLLNLGTSYLPTSSFLFNLSHILENNLCSIEELERELDTFILSTFVSQENENPLTIRIYDSHLLKLGTDVNPNFYKKVIEILVEKFNSYSSDDICLPTIEIHHAILDSLRDLRIQILFESFDGISYEEASEIIDSVFAWKVNNTKLLVILETLNERTNSNADIKSIEKKLLSANVQNSSRHSSYTEEYPWNINYHSSLKIKHLYVNSQFFKMSSFNSFATVTIDYSVLEIQNRIEEIIEAAYKLGLLRKRIVLSKKSKLSPLKISIFNVSDLAENLTELLYKKKIELMDRNLLDVNIEISYSPEIVEKKMQPQKSECFYISSDAHYNYNSVNKLSYRFHPSNYTIFCGDSSDNVNLSTEWLKSHIKKGLFVHGDSFACNSNMTLQECIRVLEKEFPLTNSLKYLNNQAIEFNNKVFLGTCLYTNFSLPDVDVESALKYARKRAPEFQKVTVESINGKTRLLDPQDYIDYNGKSLEFLQEKLKEYKGEEVIVISHFAPLVQSLKDCDGIVKKPYYANDLSTLIDNNPNIKLWCHGHVPNKVLYKYETTTVVASIPKFSLKSNWIRGFIVPFNNTENYLNKMFMTHFVKNPKFLAPYGRKEI